MRSTVWLVLVVLCTPAMLSAATLKVPADYPTIAEALAAAAQGDTVQLARGTYNENGLVVDVGIVLKGSGATIDGNVGGVDEPILVINGDNAVVTGVRFQNGNNGPDLGQLVINGSFATVSKCTFRGGETCIRIVGDNALVSGNRISNRDGGDFINVTGNQARILKNRIINGDGNVSVVGNHATIARNFISTIEDEGSIDVNGDDALITSNTCVGTDDDSIDVEGDRATIRKNTLRDTNGTAIVVAGDSYRIEGNRIYNIADDSDGIDVTQTTGDASGGGVISGNRLAYIVEQGLDLDVHGATIEKNTIIYCGAEGERSIQIEGDDNQVTDCTVFDSEHHGFYIRGNNNTLTGCRALGSHKDGFHIADGSDNTRLEDCEAIDCGGEGLDNESGATNTRAIDCTFEGNHLDIADGNSGIVDLAGTTFDTGGPGTPSEVD